MRILHCNTLEKKGGAARSALRIVECLKQREVDVDYYYLYKDKQETKSNLPKIDALPKLIFSRRRKSPFSSSLFSFGHRKDIKKYSPDIVHLHYINMGLFSIRDIGEIKEPIVWTLHDSWAFTGGCHLPRECQSYKTKCNNCPALGSHRNFDLSTYVFSLKRKYWKDKDITLVCPSRWLASKAKESFLFEKGSVRVIANPINTEVFKPRNRVLARKKYKLDDNKKYILFGAVNPVGDANKGFKLLNEALERTNLKNTELLLLGTEAKVKTKIPVRSLGYIDNDKDLSYLYSAADISVNSSLSENLPNVLIESLACGTPCVAFDVGGIPEIINKRDYGIVVKKFNTNELGKAIEDILSNQERLDRKNIHIDIEQSYGYSTISKKYLELYKELLS